ncbi:hypothetical protein [Paenibacillus sp. J22TS3]|uniref:hypothetical protein n=1 Tax=Paenibacillus sp. J22TS3 TaxID=2807192 RepID=UPI001BCC3B3D|nr:hypothetical protein [Paenibacillus sp. J22TS3]
MGAPAVWDALCCASSCYDLLSALSLRESLLLRCRALGRVLFVLLPAAACWGALPAGIAAPLVQGA